MKFSLTSSRPVVENEWSYTSCSPIRFHGVDGENITISPILQAYKSKISHPNIS